MYTNRIQLGETDRVEVLALDSSGVGVTGATVTLAVRRTRDGYWWNGSSRVFQSSFTSNTMSQTDSTNMPGLYHYDFFPATTDFKVQYYATSSTGSVVSDPWYGECVVGYWVDNVDDEITSRGSDEDLQQVLSRIGGTVLEVDLQRLSVLLHELLTLLKSRPELNV
jgi:hypothetical protein